MNILVVNDDGIDAIGIRKLADALMEAGDIYVCAPHRQQSAAGHGITIGRVVFIESVAFAGAKQAISMQGTPADCVKIGIEVYRDRGIEIDMVFSGFNHGMNLGTDTLYSGTVSAALEGALCGLPSAAVSISSNESYHHTPVHFDYAMRLALAIAKSPAFSVGGPSGRIVPEIDFIREQHTILNVNIPDLPEEEIGGTRVCPLSYRAYDEWFRSSEDESGRIGYHYSGAPLVIGDAAPEDSDVIANGHGYATITPLKFDLTDFDLLAAARAEWNGVKI
ncbi:MAG: 5'/3'-nucleotidase SurE [Clostridiales Family XIII bacterium]|nr:5'/3'-nucleotidase SurE [Clostridiales Family XIII bacterium]